LGSLVVIGEKAVQVGVAGIDASKDELGKVGEGPWVCRVVRSHVSTTFAGRSISSVGGTTVALNRGS
jgi:hypothetical protein